MGMLTSGALKTMLFVSKVLEKPCCRKSRVLIIRGSMFNVFSEALGAVCVTFLALGTGLKIECFLKVNLGILNGSRKYRHDQGYSKKVALGLH